MKHLSLFPILLVCCFLQQSTSAQGIDRAISGGMVSTPELHNVSCGSVGSCQCTLDDKWCYRPTNLVVRVPDSKWVFTGKPYLVIDDDGQGSAQWNMLDRRDHCPADRYIVTLNNPDEIHVQIKSGSRSFRCHLECTAHRD